VELSRQPAALFPSDSQCRCHFLNKRHAKRLFELCIPAPDTKIAYDASAFEPAAHAVLARPKCSNLFCRSFEPSNQSFAAPQLIVVAVKHALGLGYGIFVATTCLRRI
jgi:hypothetical protein